MFFSKKFAPNAFRSLEVWLKHHVCSFNPIFSNPGKESHFQHQLFYLNLCRDDPLKRQPKKKTTPLFFRDFRRSSEIDGLLLVTPRKTNILNPQHLMVVWFLRWFFQPGPIFVHTGPNDFIIVHQLLKCEGVHTQPPPLKSGDLCVSGYWTPTLGIWAFEKTCTKTFLKRLDGDEKGSRFDGFKKFGWRTCPCPACWCQVPRSYYIFWMCHCYFLEVIASEGLYNSHLPDEG